MTPQSNSVAWNACATLWLGCWVLLTNADGGVMMGGGSFFQSPPKHLDFPLSNSYAHNCGGTPNGTRGHISTPGFPRKFPVPLSCQWVFHIPQGKKIVLYFTQFYMREAFQASISDFGAPFLCSLLGRVFSFSTWMSKLPDAPVEPHRQHQTEAYRFKDFSNLGQLINQ